MPGPIHVHSDGTADDDPGCPANCGHDERRSVSPAMTENRVHRADCPLFAEGIEHEGFCPTDPQWRIRAMTEHRVPTHTATQAFARLRETASDTLAYLLDPRLPRPNLVEAAKALEAAEYWIAKSEQPAPPLEGMHGGDHECRRCGLSFPLEQPAPPHRFVAAYFGDPDRDPACGICRRPFVEHREQPAPPLDQRAAIDYAVHLMEEAFEGAAPVHAVAIRRHIEVITSLSEQPAPPLDVEQVVNQIRQRIVQRTNVEEWGRDALIEYGVVMDILDEVARND